MISRSRPSCTLGSKTTVTVSMGIVLAISNAPSTKRTCSAETRPSRPLRSSALRRTVIRRSAIVIPRAAIEQGAIGVQELLAGGHGGEPRGAPRRAGADRRAQLSAAQQPLHGGG